MGKSSTLIYLYSNFEETELVTDDTFMNELKEFENMLNFLEENTKKIPDEIVDQVLDIAKNYS